MRLYHLDGYLREDVWVLLTMSTLLSRKYLFKCRGYFGVVLFLVRCLLISGNLVLGIGDYFTHAG